MKRLPVKAIVVKFKHSNTYAAIMPAANGKHIVITPWAMLGVNVVMEWYIKEYYTRVERHNMSKIKPYEPDASMTRKPKFTNYR